MSVELVSPLAGTVAMQHVEDGARVEDGEAVVEVEAMKMMWTVAATCSGIVRHRAALGSVVGQDDVLAIIES